jgi:hypothetical protein
MAYFIPTLNIDIFISIYLPNSKIVLYRELLSIDAIHQASTGRRISADFAKGENFIVIFQYNNHNLCFLDV